MHELSALFSTGTLSMIAVCYGYRIKLYRIDIIRDMIMQLNFTYLQKKLDSIQNTWLLHKQAGYDLLSESSMYLIPYANSLKYTHSLGN